MPNTVRTHPWLVGGLAALAAAATVGVLALAGTFDTSDTPRSTAPTPVVVVAPSSGSIDQANANGAVGAGAATQTGGFTYEGPRGDTKGDIPSSKPANELGHGAAGYQNENEAGAGH
jgi:hypothetical protein